MSFDVNVSLSDALLLPRWGLHNGVVTASSRGARGTGPSSAPRIALVGTELAPLQAGSGALERAVLAWAAALSDRGHEVACLDAGSHGLPEAELAAFGPDVLVLNNRPLWGLGAPCPALHVLHNYEDAWGAAGDDPRLGAVLGSGVAAAVSRTLAGEVEASYGLEQVGVAVVEVEECFFGEAWDGAGGPVLFPNRLLEKKGVRLFLELSALLAAEGLRCTMFRHLAPWTSPTREHQVLLDAVAACPTVELSDPPPTREAMARAYAGAAVVVCPSLRPEGLGMVALEAQAVGAPLVTSGAGGLADATFEPNETVSVLRPHTWRDAVMRAVERKAGGAAAAIVRHGYGQAAASRSIASLVEAAAGPRTRQQRLRPP